MLMTQKCVPDTTLVICPNFVTITNTVHMNEHFALHFSNFSRKENKTGTQQVNIHNKNLQYNNDQMQNDVLWVCFVFVK